MLKMSRNLVFIVSLTICFIGGCAGGPDAGPGANAPLSAGNLNLIFVVSPDLAYHAPGDVNPDTANLTPRGLQRSLLMAEFLKQRVLGTRNVTRIHVLEPMTHPQTARQYPDMAAIGYIQQFAFLNRVTLTGAGGAGSPFYTADSYPLSVSPVTSSAADPLNYCPDCQGLVFNDAKGDNLSLVAGLIQVAAPGFHVFTAPWETVSALLAGIDRQEGYRLTLPADFRGPDIVYAISISPSGTARLVTYDGRLNPPAGYPVLPAPVACASCPAPATHPALFRITTAVGVNGAVAPKGINTNQTVYLIRHAEAHPWRGWDDGNLVAAGQWRALALPDALRGKISPAMVYSSDPAQVGPGAFITAGHSSFSYVRPALTIEPYAIANNLPFYLVSDIKISDPAPLSPNPGHNPYPAEIVKTNRFFFFNPRFSNQTMLVAWEHLHFPYFIRELLFEYYPPRGAGAPPVPEWPEDDYDTIWTVTLDARGNLTVDNALYEGIDSAKLPAAAPRF